MTGTETPQPPEDPEQEGIPDHAADTSTAYEESDRPRFDDSPPALPAEQPQALEEHGTTAAEARQGEPLADRLAREAPDETAAGRGAARGGRSAEEAAMHEVDEDEIPDER